MDFIFVDFGIARKIAITSAAASSATTGRTK